MTTKATKSVTGDLLPGTSLAHTTPPAMPRNFLSRKELFHLIDTRSPGATIVVAPSGYGKTTLVAEWAHQNKGQTFWASATGNEKASDFRNIVFQAVRNVLPDFAPWFKANIAMGSNEIFQKFFEMLFWELSLITFHQCYSFFSRNMTITDFMGCIFYTTPQSKFYKP
jgi:ATP/maltotriose-dependent transcriptional regulator MalT